MILYQLIPQQVGTNLKPDYMVRESWHAENISGAEHDNFKKKKNSTA
jgi:hypothetical protein